MTYQHRQTVTAILLAAAVTRSSLAQAVPPRARDTAFLDSVFYAHRYPVAIQRGRLTGPGARDDLRIENMMTTSRTTLCTLASLAVVLPAFSAQMRVMQPDDLFRIERIEAIARSADGARAAVQNTRPGRQIGASTSVFCGTGTLPKTRDAHLGGTSRPWRSSIRTTRSAPLCGPLARITSSSVQTSRS